MLSETNIYQRILVDLAWLDRNVRLDPVDFANEHLAEIADSLLELVELVSEGQL